MVREKGKSISSCSSTYYNDDHGSSSSNNNNSKSCLSNRSKLFAKRTVSLKKKIYELTTLCDLDGCMIVKGPNGELETWPGNRDEVEHVVQRYKDMNEEDRQKNNRDLSSFLIEKKMKLEIKIDKIRNENDSKMKSLYPTWDKKKLDELSEDSLRDMQCSLESKLNNVNSRVKMMMNRGDGHHIENFAAMGDGGLIYDQDYPLLSLVVINPPLVPQTREFHDFNSYHRQQQQQNHRGTKASMYNPAGFGMIENHPQYYTKLMGDDGNYSTNMPSQPPLPPTVNFFHVQPPPLQTCAPAASSFQTGDHENFFDGIYLHHEQQEQDLGYMNGGDTN